jgi:hypothetical protein
MTTPHDAPSAAQLVEAVREFLERDVMAATDGRVQFHTRVAINVLRMVERELAVGAAQEAEHSLGLAQLGFTSEAALAAAIRGGQITDDQLPAVAAFVTETVRAKLEVANPGYLDNSSRPGAGGS